MVSVYNNDITTSTYFVKYPVDIFLKYLIATAYSIVDKYFTEKTSLYGEVRTIIKFDTSFIFIYIYNWFDI